VVLKSGAISYMTSAESYYAIVELIKGEPDASIGWRQLLTLTEQSGIRRLAAIDVNPEITSVAHQLETVWSQEPIPEDTTFLYFGLYDLHDEKMPKGRAGFYVSGGNASNPTKELEVGGTLSYLPKNRNLKCQLLQQIKIAEYELPEQADVLDYAVMLGAAALIVKGATQIRGVSLPVYVGFDSGDFLPVLAKR